MNLINRFMGNVVQFPVNRIANSLNVGIKLDLAEGDIRSNLLLVHHVIVDELLENLLTTISRQIHEAGFNLDKDCSMKYGALLIEALRSLLNSQYHIAHPFQKLAEELFSIDADGLLHLNNKVDIEFVETIDE